MNHIYNYRGSNNSQDLNDFEIENNVQDDDFKHRDSDFEYENTTFNSATLEEIKDVLYELNEYFDEFEIELTYCPNLTKEPYNLNFEGLSGNERIAEIYDPCLIIRTLDANSARMMSLRSNNCYLNNERPGIVLKIRAKGRKTNYSFVMLMQSILHKRFPFRIGLGGVLVINGGQAITGYSDLKNVSTRYNYINGQLQAEHVNVKTVAKLMCHFINCDTALITTGTIINDAIKMTKHNTIVLVDKSYLFQTCSLRLPEIFMNDITPMETEYIGYFNIAKEINRLY